MAPQQRTRSTNLQTTPVPNPVTQRTDRSVVSELTTPSPSAAAALQAAEDSSDDDEDYDHLVREEIEKDINGGDGGDSDLEGDECLIFESDDESESESVIVEAKDFGTSKGFVDLTDSSGGVVGNVIFEEGDVCRAGGIG